MNGRLSWRRPDPQRVLERDVARRVRRERGSGTFWRSLGLVGMVGWPIALLTLGGALLGRAIDVRLGTGLHATLMLLTLGVILGALVAWRAITRGGPSS